MTGIIYEDEEISPLMMKIIEICQAHDMPMFAEFQFSDDGFCKSKIPGDIVFSHYDAISQSKQDGGVNVDKYMFWVMREARKTGHSSMVLSQLGIKHKPEDEE